MLYVPEKDTAQNSDNSGDQHTVSQLELATVYVLHNIPFEDVITLAVDEVLDTAQNIDNSEDQHTLVH